MTWEGRWFTGEGASMGVIGKQRKPHFLGLYLITGDDGGRYGVICAALRMCWFGDGVS